MASTRRAQPHRRQLGATAPTSHVSAIAGIGDLRQEVPQGLQRRHVHRRDGPSSAGDLAIVYTQTPTARRQQYPARPPPPPPSRRRCRLRGSTRSSSSACWPARRPAARSSHRCSSISRTRFRRCSIRRAASRVEYEYAPKYLTPAISSQAGSAVNECSRKPGRETLEVVLTYAYSKRALNVVITHGVKVKRAVPKYAPSSPREPPTRISAHTKRRLCAQHMRGCGSGSRDAAQVDEGGAFAGAPHRDLGGAPGAHHPQARSCAHRGRRGERDAAPVQRGARSEGGQEEGGNEVVP